jgi:uncharacterized protein
MTAVARYEQAAMPTAPASSALSRPCTAFAGVRRLAAGPLIEVALAVKAEMSRASVEPILVFDDTTAHVIDLDLRGSKQEITARLQEVSSDRQARRSAQHAATDAERAAEKRGRGRPKLGVIPREVTLLPRHWDWLAAQPGGASVTLRRLVDEARRTGAASQQQREAREVAYRFMSAMAGNLPGFEEALRALFAGDARRFASHVDGWPKDVAAHATKLAAAGLATRGARSS